MVATESEKLKSIEALEKQINEERIKYAALLEGIATSFVNIRLDYETFANHINENTQSENSDLSYYVQIPFRQEDFVAKWVETFGVQKKSREVVDAGNFASDNYSASLLKSIIEKTLCDELKPIKGFSNEQALMTVFSIVPDRPYINEKYVEMLTKLFFEQMKKDNFKEFELAHHTPNMMESQKIFCSMAHAMLSDSGEADKAEVAKLADKLRNQAVIKSDWPLEIKAGTKKEAQENPLKATSEIDCPEYLLYHVYQGGCWSLKKIENLKAAQQIITKDGYNKKGTALIVVFHNLKPVPFILLEETADGLVLLEKVNAPGKKNLHLSWNK